jgi:ABC-type Fe3+-hydroxamate transport system substrate-binding protein
MMKKVAFALLAVLFLAGLAVAGEAAKEASGTVKSVSATGFVVTDAAGKDWSFDVDKSTTVLAKGASHKMDALKADGKPTQLTEFLSAKQAVSVRYVEKDGTMTAKEVRAK